MSTFLSIIIPAHNEENRLPNTLEQVFRFLEKQSFTSEVIIVENGSMDKTLQVAQTFAETHPSFRVIQSERGKGTAVQHGMLEAQGEYLFMCDADLSMPVEEIIKFIPPAFEGFDIAIGSREAKGAVRYNEPPYRHLGGRGINFIIQLLILPGLERYTMRVQVFPRRCCQRHLPKANHAWLVIRYRTALYRTPTWL